MAESLLAFVIACGVTLFFVRRYVKSLASARGSAASRQSHAAAAVGPSAPCPRCSKPVLQGASFCPSCGASMALWNVHRAAIQEGGSGQSKSGKPRPVINATLCIGCGSCVDACPEAGTLALAGGKAILANPELCVGHAKCIDVCPTSAITLAFGNVLQTLRVPLVRENFETNVEGVYIVGELSGMGLIKTSINEGRLAVDGIRKRLQADGAWQPPQVDSEGGRLNGDASRDEVFDVVIIGAGPAGLSASLTAHQHGLHYLALEQGEIAATIRNYPRHKFLMAEPIEMPLYGNLYIGDGTKEALLHVWEAIIANTGVRVRTNTRVESVVRENGAFRVHTTAGSFQGRHVILALGKRGTPRRLGVSGEQLSKVAYGLIEAESYQDRDILVVGGGDSAIEASLALSKASRNRVTLAYRGGSFDRARERNLKSLLDAEGSGRLTILRNCTVQEIQEDSVVLEQAGATIGLPNHYVFILIGGEPPEMFLRKTGIEIVEKAVTA